MSLTSGCGGTEWLQNSLEVLFPQHLFRLHFTGSACIHRAQRVLVHFCENPQQNSSRQLLLENKEKKQPQRIGQSPKTRLLTDAADVRLQNGQLKFQAPLLLQIQYISIVEQTCCSVPRYIQPRQCTEFKWKTPSKTHATLPSYFTLQPAIRSADPFKREAETLRNAGSKENAGKVCSYQINRCLFMFLVLCCSHFSNGWMLLLYSGVNCKLKDETRLIFGITGFCFDPFRRLTGVHKRAFAALPQPVLLTRGHGSDSFL